jgi:hypothetical protein
MDLMRSTGSFDGAGAAGHLAVLLTWTLAGLAALLAGSAVGRRAVPARAAVDARGSA